MFLRYLLMCVLFLQAACYHMNVGATGVLFSYSLGALSYIKTCLRPTDYKLIGVSGGAWCSLIYHFEKDIHDHDLLWSILVGSKSDSIMLYSKKSMQTLQFTVAHNMKERYKDISVENIPISILATKFHKGRLHNVLIDKFDDINHLVDICLCSSYIPFISGGKPYMVYRNEKYVDGAIMRNHKLYFNNSATLNINIHTWKPKIRFRDKFILNFETSKKLFQQGWQDAKHNL